MGNQDDTNTSKLPVPPAEVNNVATVVTTASQGQVQQTQPIQSNTMPSQYNMQQQNMQQQNMQQQNMQQQPHMHHQPIYHQGYHMGFNNQPQPSAAQPLQYPQYGGYYGHQQHQHGYSGYYYPPQPHMHNNMFQQAHPPPPVQYNTGQQQPMASGSNTSGNNTRNDDTGDGEDNDSLGENEPCPTEVPQYTGALADKLHKWAAEKKVNPTEGPEVYPALAEFISDQLQNGFSTQELDQSIKTYPTIKNVPRAMAPDLESEIYDYKSFKNDGGVRATDVTFKSIQKGIAAAINAFGPLAEVIMRQGDDNPELDAVSTPVLDIIRYLANALNGISKKRRDLMRPHIDQKYQKLAKTDEDFDPKFLFGGNFSERARKVRARDTLMKEVMKSDDKSHPQGQKRRQQNQNSGPVRPHNNFGGQRPKQTPYNRPNHARNTGGGSNPSGHPGGQRDFRKTGSSNNNGKRS